jgi:hypothetical protein
VHESFSRPLEGGDVIAAAEKRHRLLLVKGGLGKDGRFPITAEDLTTNYAVLFCVVRELSGLQPPASTYQRAVHALDLVLVCLIRAWGSLKHYFSNNTFHNANSTHTTVYVVESSVFEQHFSQLELVTQRFMQHCNAIHNGANETTNTTPSTSRTRPFDGPHHTRVIEASNLQLSGEKSTDVPSGWALLDGQMMHDLVAYLYKLRRDSENSWNPQILSLKKLVPDEPKTRKRKSPDGLPDRCMH